MVTSIQAKLVGQNFLLGLLKSGKNISISLGLHFQTFAIETEVIVGNEREDATSSDKGDHLQLFHENLRFLITRQSLL